MTKRHPQAIMFFTVVINRTHLNIKSPYTGGRVKEVFTTEEMNYQGHTYIIPVRYYQCEDTGEKFTTTKQDQEWYEELHRQANVKYPAPEDISCFVAEDIHK